MTLIAALAWAQAAFASESRTIQDEREIRRALQGTTDAYARGDAKGAMAAYRQDEKLHLFDVMAPPERKGYATSLKATEDAINGAKGPIEMVWKDPVVIVSGDYAFSYALVHMVADMKNGSRTDMLVRNTDVWQRLDGRWQIIHEHNSLPLDPAAAAKLVGAAPD